MGWQTLDEAVAIIGGLIPLSLALGSFLTGGP
jgi:hypothetical protein